MPGEIEWKNASGYLYKAHIVDIVCDGPDVVENVAPLCGWCHADQPMFELPDEEYARQWFGVTPETFMNEDRFEVLGALRRACRSIGGHVDFSGFPEDRVNAYVGELLEVAKLPFLGKFRAVRFNRELDQGQDVQVCSGDAE